jgi:acyl-homoserine lactone acylase PvdQ
MNIRFTQHGPIINDIIGGTEEEWTFGWQPLSLDWVGFEAGILIKSVLLLNQAQDWETFQEALAYWDTPGQNFVYADVEGNIGYQAAGKIPIRTQGNGALPVPGWTGSMNGKDIYFMMSYLLNLIQTMDISLQQIMQLLIRATPILLLSTGIPVIEQIEL